MQEYVVVPVSDHPVALRFQYGGPARVVLGLFGMLSAVELDDELRQRADEIDDVRADRNLPAETEAFHLASAQESPELALGVRALVSQLACEQALRVQELYPSQLSPSPSAN